MMEARVDVVCRQASCRQPTLGAHASELSQVHRRLLRGSSAAADGTVVLEDGLDGVSERRIGGVTSPRVTDPCAARRLVAASAAGAWIPDRERTQ